MNGEFIDALEQLQREKDIPMDALIETVEAAMASAYRKKYGVNEDIRLEIDFEGRGVTMYARRLVEPIGTVTATAEETEVATATPEGEAAVATGVTYEEHEVDPAEFTRIAAQTFKQVVMQRVREAEREIMFDEFSHRVGEVITGEVQRKDARNVIVTRFRARPSASATSSSSMSWTCGAPPGARRLSCQGDTPAWSSGCSRWRSRRSPTASSS